jgi:3-carboxy-cis,cis-muconate cycloisomerase
MSAATKTSTREKYFGDEARWQSWLKVEAEMADAQAEIGMIPKAAAEEIAKHADIKKLDIEALRAEINKTMAPVFAMTRVLAAAAGEAGDYVHWGSTTQNIMDTGRLLILQQIQRKLLSSLGDVLNRLCNLADDNADVVMVGRTQRQHALPITFGFKVAGWIDELIRVINQLEEIEPRLFQLRFAGAIGAYHSTGPDGRRVSEILAKRFNLHISMVPNRTSSDPWVEYITKLSMIGVAAGRIADELYLLMTEEISEIRENFSKDVVGSSTMPQKVNPKRVIELRVLANLLRSKGAAVFVIPSPSHEGDAASNQELIVHVEEGASLAVDVVNKFVETLNNIEPCHDRMEENIASSEEMIATEALMMRLAPSIGRGRAHDLVHELVVESVEKKIPFRAVLNNHAEISGILTPEEIGDVLTARNNTGLCSAIAKEAARAGRQILKNTKVHSN